MNISNLDRANGLRSRLSNVSRQLQQGKQGGVGITGYGGSLHVTAATLAAVQTLVLADLEKQVKDVTDELAAIGVSVDDSKADAKANGAKLRDAEAAVAAAVLGSIFLDPGALAATRRRHG